MQAHSNFCVFTELVGDLGCELVVLCQTCNFVLVLVGHQFEQVARHGVGEAAYLGLAFGACDVTDEPDVIGCVGDALVVDQFIDPAANRAQHLGAHAVQ